MSGGGPLSAFEQLTRRKMTQEELRTLVILKDELGLHDNDAIWTILIALQIYLSLYKEMPAQIVAATTATLDETKATAEKQTAAVLAQSRDRVVAEMASAARSIAKNVAGRDYAVAVGLTIALSLSLVTAVTVFAYGEGKKSGVAQAEAVYRDQESWAQSRPGLQARILHDRGYLDAFKRCELVGYKVVGGRCTYDPKQGAGFSQWPTFSHPSQTAAEKDAEQRAVVKAAG